MLKRNVTYTDFNGEQQTEVFRFNLTQSELLRMEAGGLPAVLQRIVDTQDKEGLVRQFDWFILQAYGVVSEDGKKFLKSDELRDDFFQSAAYDALFIELASSEQAFVDFIKAVVPAEALQAFAGDQDKPSGPPLPQTTEG